MSTTPDSSGARTFRFRLRSSHPAATPEERRHLCPISRNLPPSVVKTIRGSLPR